MENRYEFDRNALPEPVVSGKPEWIALYYQAWKIAFENIEYIEKEGWKPQLTCMPGAGTV